MGSLFADHWSFFYKYKINPKINYSQWQKSHTAYGKAAFTKPVFKSVFYTRKLNGSR